MKRKRVDSGMERQFLTAMIVSKPFLASIAPVIDVSLLQAKHFRTVAEWCLSYFKEYGDAPGTHIEGLYHAWAEDRDPKDPDVDAIHDFLSYLSELHDAAKDLNVPFLLDEIGTYLSMKKVGRLNDTLSSCLLNGNKDEALNSISTFSSVNLGDGAGFDPLNDRARWEAAFADPMEPLIEYPGAAGEFFGRVLTRDALIGVQGPEKRGKTFWCVDFVHRALLSRKKVALFEVGDLSESQIMKRLGVRLARLPMWKNQLAGVDYPTKIELDKDDEGKPVAVVTTDKKTFPHIVSAQSSWKARRRFLKACGIPPRIPYVKFSIHPNSSINVVGIRGILQRWQHEEEFVPDVIVIDYADILAPEDPRKEFRHQVNETWKALRRMSQECHALVIAPTQAAASSYSTKTQSMANFSEDKRKYAHVTGMLGLNQEEHEKEKGVMRLNWIVLRESDFVTKRCLWVAQCLPLARAIVCSTL